MFNRSLAPVALTLALFGCEPVTPDIEEGPDPAEGEWKMEIISAESHGACGLSTDADILGMVLSMELETRGEHGIRFDLEGMSLKGYMDAGWIHAEGRIVENFVTGVEVEVEDEPDDEPDVDARTTADDGDRRGAGVHATIEATTLTQISMEGELVIAYDMPEMQCLLVLEFEADHVDRGDRDPPVTVAPTEDPEKPEDIPVEADED